MIIVDTAAWAGYFNGQANPHTDRLDEALATQEDIAVLPIIVTEVLQGFKADTGFREAKRVLLPLPRFSLSIGGHVRAAQLFRRLRKNGVTVRGAVDCLIAQTCIESGTRLLSPDRDFLRIAEHSPLRVWQP